MNATAYRVRNGVFVAVLVVFGLLLGSFMMGGRPVVFTLGLAIALGLLGLVLVVLAARLPEARLPKGFLLLTGISAAGIPISVILHNLVYGLFLSWFGEEFWQRHGSDEPVFFILALFVFPGLLVIGAIGTIVMWIKRRPASPIHP